MRLFSNSRRFLGFAVALLVTLTGLVAIDAAPGHAATDKTVIVHVAKGDSNFTGLNLWMWYTGGDGKAYEFTGTDSYGTYGQWSLPGSGGASSVGFILRDNSWNKYPDGDRFISNFTTINGVDTAEIWIKYNSKFIWQKKPSDQPTLLAAQVTGLKELKLTFDNSFDLNAEKSNFSVKNSSGQDVAIDSFGPLQGNAAVGYTLKINLVDQVRIGTAYTISHPVFGSQEYFGRARGGLIFTMLMHSLYLIT